MDTTMVIYKELAEQYEQWFEFWINFYPDMNPEEFFNEVVRLTQVFYEEKIPQLLNDYYADEE